MVHLHGPPPGLDRWVIRMDLQLQLNDAPKWGRMLSDILGVLPNPLQIKGRVMQKCIVFFLLVAVLPSLGLAQDCIDFEDYIHVVGQISEPTYVADMVVSGDYAYLAAWDSGLQVLDISDSENPVIVGGVETPGGAVSVAVWGTHAFVADSYIWDRSGLQVIDISNPENPQIVGSIDTPGDAKHVAVAGNYAYLADGDALQVIDISNPERPQIIRSLDVEAKYVTIAEYYAYVGGDGFHVVDITNPEIAQVVSSWPAANVSNIEISGNHAYFTRYDYGFVVMDISDPLNPQVLSESYSGFSGDLTDVAISGSHAYVTNGNGLVVFDILDPENPHYAGRFLTQGYSDVAVTIGTFVLVGASRSGVQIIETAIPEFPQVTGRCEPQHCILDLVIDGAWAYAADDFILQVIDIANPDNPEIAASLELPGSIHAVTASENYVFAAYYEQDVRSDLGVIDISIPLHPRIVGSVETEGTAADVLVVDTHAYLAGPAGGLEVIDISNPESPQVVGGIELPGQHYSVAIADSLAYIASGSSGLQVVNIADPSNPQISGSVMTWGYPSKVVISGTCAYVLDEENTLLGVDISDPTNLQVIWRNSIGLPPLDMVVSNKHVYILVWDHGYGASCEVYNISDSGYPQPASSVDLGVGQLGFPFNGMSISDSHVFLGACEDGLVVFPTACDELVPVYLSSFNLTPGSDFVTATWLVSGPGNPADFNLQASNGATAWDVSCEHDGFGSFTAIDQSTHLSGGGLITYRLSMNAGDGGWTLVDQKSVTMEIVSPVTRLFAPFPNPFNPQTGISFETNTPGLVDLGIYDLAGRRVVSLVTGWVEAGRHTTTWNGNNSAGHVVASGQYFVLLQTAEKIDVRKVMLSK